MIMKATCTAFQCLKLPVATSLQIFHTLGGVSAFWTFLTDVLHQSASCRQGPCTNIHACKRHLHMILCPLVPRQTCSVTSGDSLQILLVWDKALQPQHVTAMPSNIMHTRLLDNLNCCHDHASALSPGCGMLQCAEPALARRQLCHC
jgi:hypothetical protein